MPLYTMHQLSLRSPFSKILLATILFGFVAILFTFASRSAYAQIPTTGLAAEYDMTTLTGTSTLDDISGNGNNGTLHGTTPGTKGIAFNGTSDYVSIPAVIGNSDFTAFVCASTGSNSGRMWEENSSSGAPSMWMNPSNGGFNTGSNNYQSVISVKPFNSDWHCFYTMRQGSSVKYGVLDQNAFQTLDIGTVTISTSQASLGAQTYTGGANSYFQGTIGYVYIYTRALSSSEMVDLYNSARTALLSRGVYMRDIVTSLYPGRVWQHQGEILDGSGASIDGAQPVITYTTTDCQMVANPCFQLWYEDGTGVEYAESTPGANGGPQSWVIHSGSVLSGIAEASVTKVTGFTFKYLMLATKAINGPIYVYTSSDPIHFTLAQVAPAIPLGSGSAWDSSSVDNTSVQQIGTTLYAVYDGSSSGSYGYQCGGATSTDGLNWTKVAANPISGLGDLQGCGGPHVWFDAADNTWYMWTHNDLADDFGLFRRSSSNFNSIWQTSSPTSVWTGAETGSFPTFSGGAPDESSQLATPSLTEVNGKTYMVYCASDSSNILKVKLAIANMTMAQLVQTGEGDVSATP